MSDLFVFKYEDQTDNNFAFVISSTEEQAREIINEETSLEIFLVGTRNLEDLPKALEHWNETKNPIYINRILPF